jgi:hypothetical protein
MSTTRLDVPQASSSMTTASSAGEPRELLRDARSEGGIRFEPRSRFPFCAHEPLESDERGAR